MNGHVEATMTHAQLHQDKNYSEHNSKKKKKKSDLKLTSQVASTYMLKKKRGWSIWRFRKLMAG